MPKNSGKIFEEDFKGSISRDYFIYRLKDGTAGFKGAKNENVRFQATNTCDFIVFANGWLHLLELKSHKGASIPLGQKFNDSGKLTHYGIIKVNQLNGLLKECNKNKVNAGFVFNLAEKEKTWFVEATDVNNAIEAKRKSLSIEWLEQYGMLIPQQKKISRYRYDLSVLLD